MDDINGSLASVWFSLELARWKQLVDFELPPLESASINVPLVFFWISPKLVLTKRWKQRGKWKRMAR